MNWGKGIVMGMALFMLFILSMCVYMFMLPADEYDHQYYEKGLSFNQDYNREAQVGKDHAKPIIKQVENNIQVTFAAQVSGHIKFTRPSNAMLDKTFALNSDGGLVTEIPIDGLKTGEWQLVLDWESNHKAYLYQQEIFIKSPPAP